MVTTESQWFPPAGTTTADGQELTAEQTEALSFGPEEASPTLAFTTGLGKEADATRGRLESSDSGEGTDGSSPTTTGPMLVVPDTRAFSSGAQGGKRQPHGSPSLSMASSSHSASLARGRSHESRPPHHVPGVLYSDPAGRDSSYVVRADDAVSAARLEAGGWEPAGAVAFVPGGTTSPDHNRRREEFRAIIKADGTIFFQSLETKETTWTLPKGAKVVQRARQKQAAAATIGAVRAVGRFKAALAKRRAAEPSDAEKLDAAPLRELAGWVMKTRDIAKGGRPGWKRRFAVLDRGKRTLRYFARNPAVSLDRYGVTEPEKGSLPLEGAKVALLAEGLPRGCGASTAVDIAGADGRRTVITAVVEPGSSVKSGSPTIKAWLSGMQRASTAAERSERTATSSAPGRLIMEVERVRDRATAAVAAAVHPRPDLETFLRPLPSHDAHVCTNGRVWDACSVALLPAARMLLVQPPGAGARQAPCFSAHLTGATIDLVRPAGRGIELHLVERPMSPDQARIQTAGTTLPSVMLKLAGSHEDVALFTAAAQAVRDLEPIRSPALRGLCGRDIHGDPSAIAVPSMKCGPSGTGWKRRTLQASPAGGFLRYLAVEDALGMSDPDVVAKGRLCLSDGPIRVAAGTGPLPAAAPSPLGMRVYAGAREYIFCFTGAEEFAVMYGCLGLLHLKSEAGLA